MASTYVVNYADARQIVFPVSGAGANIPVGTLLMPGVTGSTNLGVLIPVTAASNADALGVLNEAHVFASSGDATTATLVQWFPAAGFPGNSQNQGVVISPTSLFYPSHQVDLFDTASLVKVDYSLASTVAVASASTVTLTITNLQAGLDSGFAYVNAGTGIGQLFNIANSTSGSMVLQTTPTGEPDNTSKLTIINPLFLNTIVWKVNSTTQPTTIDSTAAAGTGRAVNIANFISRNGLTDRLDPKLYNQTNSLNSLSQLIFYSYVQVQDTSWHPID